MARTEGPREQGSAEELPEQRQPEESGSPKQVLLPQGAPRIMDPAPQLVVIGYMENQIAVRLGWKAGMIAVSPSRFRFLRDELGMDVHDNPDDYLF